MYGGRQGHRDVYDLQHKLKTGPARFCFCFSGRQQANTKSRVPLCMWDALR